MLRLLLLCALTVLVFGCAGRGQQPAPDVRDASWLRGQLTELEGMQCPAGCDPAAWQQLKAQLAQTISDRLSGKVVSAPPTAPNARPLVQLDPTGPYLAWYFENPGDYNQDGVVSVNDLTPLGAKLGSAVPPGPFGYRSVESVIDGDSNGEINISDLTPLGANLGRSITEWRMYVADDLSAYPAAAADPSTLAPAVVRALSDSDEGPPNNRRTYFPVLPVDPAKWYWVRGADASGEGIASNPVGGGNLPPNASTLASGFSGAPPFSLTFDATGSTDPEGQALQFVWFFQDMGVYDGAIVTPEFSEEGLFAGAVIVIDEMGATDVSTVYVTSSLGEQWRISQPDNTHVLDFTDRIRLTELEGETSIAPALAFTSKEGAADVAIFISSEDIGGKEWGTPTPLESQDGLLAELDFDIVDGKPALCWLSRPTGSGTDTLVCSHSSVWWGASWNTRSVTQTLGLRELALAPAGEAGTDIGIAYHDGDAASLQYAQGRADDFVPWDINPIDNADGGGRTPALFNVFSTPGVVYWHPFSGEYRYCDSFMTPGGDVVFNAPVTALGAGAGLLGSSLTGLSSMAVFAYYAGDTGFINYVKADDVAATTFGAPFTLAGTDTLDGRCLPALARVRSRPFLAWHQPSTGSLYAAHATNSIGTTWDVTVVSTDVEPNVYPDVAEIVGKPAVAYAAADGTPRFAIFY